LKKAGKGLKNIQTSAPATKNFLRIENHREKMEKNF